MAIRIRHDNGYAAAAAQAAFQAGQAKAQREDQQQQQELRSRAALQAQGAAFDMAREQQRTRSQMLRDAYLGNQDQAKLQAQLADKQAQRDFQAQNYADLREHQANQLLMKGQQEKEFQAFKEQAPQRARELELSRLDQAEADLMARRGDNFDDEQFSTAMTEISRRRHELDMSRPEPTPEEQQAEMQRDFETSTLPDPTGNGVRWKKNKDGEWEAINPPKKEEDPQIEIAKEQQKMQVEQQKAAQARADKLRDKQIDFFLKNREYQEEDADGAKTWKTRKPAEIKKMWDEVQEFMGPEAGQEAKSGQPPQAAPAAAPSGAPAPAGGPSQPQQQAMQKFAAAGVAPIGLMPPDIQRQMEQMGQLEPEVVVDQQQYQQMPPGVVYLAPDGQVRVKGAKTGQLAAR